MALLGIEPMVPGFARFRLAPHLCGLEWAYGAFPIPCGIIQYAMEHRGDALWLRLSVPEGAVAVIREVEYPAGVHTLTV